MLHRHRPHPGPVRAAASAAFLTLTALPALAGDGARAVLLPWGDAAAALAQGIGSVLLPLAITAVTASVARLAGPLRVLITAAVVERLVRNVGDYAVNAVAGAVRGRTLSIPLGSAVIVV